MVFKAKQSFFFFLFLIVVSISSNYATAQPTWTRTYGGGGYDVATDIQQTSDSGYIVAGYKDYFPSDLWVIKFDSFGIIQWEKTFDGSVDIVLIVQQTSDGGFIVAGTTHSFGVAGDLWILKLDSSGNVEWENSYGGNAFDQIGSIRQTSDGGFIVSGATTSFGAGSFDGWLMKLNSTGAIQWQKVFGGIGGDFFFLVEQTADGGFIAGGDYRPDVSGTYDLWLVKVDANGTIQWQRGYNDNNGSEHLQSFDQTSDGGFIVAGFSSENFLLKLDSSGNIQWQKHYNTSDFAFTHSIHQTSDLGYALVGEITQSGSSDIWMMKVDSSGNIQSQKMYGNPDTNDRPRAIRSTVDGGYIFVGGSESFGAGSFDWWVLKTDASGNVDSACSFINPISFTPSDGNLTTQDTMLSSTSTVIVPIATNAIVTNTSADITEQCGNEPPAAHDDFAITSEDVSVTIDVLTNDVDPDNEPLDVTGITQASNGTVIDNGDGTVTYTPDNNFNGSDLFSYTMSDGDVNDSAVVNVTIVTGNDPPVAVNDTATTLQDIAVVIDVFSNDSDPDGSPIGVIGVTQGNNGTVANNGDGTVTYNPNPGFNGTDSFTYTISDGQFTDSATVNITVTAVNNCLLCDYFEDDVLDTNWIYNKGISSWTETAGNLTGSSNAKSTAIAGPFFPGCTMCSVTASMQTTGGFGNRVWLLYHFVDKKNFVELLMKEQSDLWVMKVRQNKTIIAKGKVLKPIDPNVLYQAKVVYTGTQYQAFVDGELVIALDVETPMNNGTVGFKLKRASGSFGYIEVFP